MPSLIEDSDNLKKAIIDGLLGDIDGVEEKIYKRILQLLEQYDTTGGYFNPSEASRKQLLRIQGEIEEILTKAGYFKRAEVYLADLSQITQNTVDLQKGINGLDIQKRFLKGIESQQVYKAKEALVTGGLNVNFVQPVTNALNEAVTFGYSVSKTRENLEKSLLDTGDGQKIAGTKTLKSYLTVTARDTVSQLQGQQQQAISNEYDMKFIRYVGGLLNDSRGQCVHWKKMQYIDRAELKDEIAQAFKNQQAKLEQPKGHRWSGMIQGTNEDNFLIYRGGWGCLHTAVPTLRKY